LDAAPWLIGSLLESGLDTSDGDAIERHLHLKSPDDRLHEQYGERHAHDSSANQYDIRLTDKALLI